MNKCLCTLVVAGLLAGCRAPYNLADLRLDRMRMAQNLQKSEEAPANEEPVAAGDKVETATHTESAERNDAAAIQLAAGRQTEKRVADNLRQGHSAAANGELDRARAFYERVVAAEPKHAQAHHRLGVLADQRRDYETAARHYMVALQQEPGSADLLNDIGYSFFLQGRLETAERYLEDAVRSQPSHTRARANLALVRKRAELAAPETTAAKTGGPDAPSSVDPSEWLHDQVAKPAPQDHMTAQQRESAYPPEPTSPVQTVAGESTPAPPGIATLGPPRAALPRIRPHNSQAEVATDLFAPLVTPLGQEREPAPVRIAEQKRVPVPPLPAPIREPGVLETVPVSLSSPGTRSPIDDERPDLSTPSAEPAADQLLTAEEALRSARVVGMNAGPGNPFPVLGPTRPGQAPPVAVSPGPYGTSRSHGTLLAAVAPQPASGPRVRITGISVSPESSQPQPHHATGAAGMSYDSAPRPSDPIESFQREVQQYHAQRDEIDLRPDRGFVVPAGGSLPPATGSSVRPASWPQTTDGPHWPQAPTQTSGW